MTRTVTITLHDGRTINYPYSAYAQAMHIPIGTPVQSHHVVKLLQSLACTGFVDEEQSTPTRMVYIAPSNIKNVTISENLQP